MIKHHFFCEIKSNQLEAENARLRCFLYQIINLATQAVNKKDFPSEDNPNKAVEYWKNKAWILANKNRLCQKHEARQAQDNFNQTGATFDEYITRAVECGDCNAEKLPVRKEVPHA